MAELNTEAERRRLDGIASVSLYGAGMNPATIAYSFEIFQRFVRPGPILEMGPAEGLMSEKLARLGLPLTIVDGAEAFCASLRERLPNADVIHSLFEEFAPAQSFETIVLGHVLEHVDDPAALLGRVRQWLTPTGRILAAVPNSRSLHRQAAVLLGMLPFEEALNEADHHHGHRRVYNPETFRRDFLQAGLKIEVFGGYWLKPLSNAQLERDWNAEQIAAFMALGERYPDIAGEIYIVANRG
jgi:2-polyprenyl-3-methyl-5-hydroxy-6-metoxy-1,4-benzoquinol methylase